MWARTLQRFAVALFPSYYYYSRLVLGKVLAEKPNIIFVLLDDVGWSDLSYNVPDQPTISTPFLDDLALGPGGIVFKQHYAHSLCTPTRAALLTGRYHINTALNFVLIPGSPAGLPPNVETLPQALKARAGYRTAISGKWHLGHAQHKCTPIGRGFDRFTGLYTWDADSYSKQMFIGVGRPYFVDWIEEFANGTYSHFAEPRHLTEAITANAEEMMVEHAAINRALEPDARHPLFLYVAYTAAHSPLQPLERHTKQCEHIPHLWRRQYCGMVGGLDEGIRNLTVTALNNLGDNTILVVSSDNGGSPWFGGMNYPLRGSKQTPYEGGVKVPAFAVDFSKDKKFLGGKIDPSTRQLAHRDDSKLQKVGSFQPQTRGLHREFQGLMHISDWLPTLLSLGGVDHSGHPRGVDGIDMSVALRGDDATVNIVSSPRKEMLVELLIANETAFGRNLWAYRMGDWKLIVGYARDPHYYYEPTRDLLNSSEHSWLIVAAQLFIRMLESHFGEGQFDTVRIGLTHNVLHTMTSQNRAKNPCNDISSKRSNNLNEECSLYQLYNLKADPLEATNVAADHPDLVQEMLSKIQTVIDHRPPQQNLILQEHPVRQYPKSLVPGDCSMNSRIKPKDCRFAHSWISDDADPYAHADQMLNAIENGRKAVSFFIVQVCVILAVIVLVPVFLVVYLVRKFFFSTSKSKKSKSA